MSLQFTAYTIPLFITTAITLILLWVGVRRRHMLTARIFMLFCSAVIVWSVGYALEFMAVDLQAKLFWARVQYLGLFSPVAFLLFTQLYLGFEERLYWQNLIVLAIMPMIANVAAWTNDQHHLLWTSWSLDESGNFPGLKLEHGIIFYAIVAYSYLLLLSGVFYIWRAFRSTSYVRRWQAAILLVAVAAPWLGNLLYVLDLTPNGLDLTPINLGVSSIFLGIGLMRYHFLDVTPIARNRIIEMLDDSVAVIDGRGRIVDLNPAAGQLLRTSSRSSVARPAYELLFELPGVVAQLETPSSTDLTTRLTVGDEEHVYNASISVLKDKEQRVQGRVVMLHDVTQQERDAEALRKSETQLRTLVQQLQELDQLKTRFVRSINHELRTPLTNITLYIDLLRNGKPENQERYLTVLDKESATLRRLIEQILDLERMDQLVNPTKINLTRTDLTFLVKSIVQSTQANAGKPQHTFHCHLPDHAIVVVADEERLGVAIRNLLVNAFTYTPPGGTITIALTSDAKQAVVRIVDNGIGISKVEQEHIFERFYRGENAASGTIPGLGVGLFTARTHVEQFGGCITVESDSGKGSTFTIYLPRTGE